MGTGRPRILRGQAYDTFAEGDEQGSGHEIGSGPWIAAIALGGRIGQSFDAIVTGVTPKGTFVRLLERHAEGLLAEGQEGVDVGDKLRVQLVSTNVARGFIDFARA